MDFSPLSLSFSSQLFQIEQLEILAAVVLLAVCVACVRCDCAWAEKTRQRRRSIRDLEEQIMSSTERMIAATTTPNGRVV